MVRDKRRSIKTLLIIVIAVVAGVFAVVTAAPFFIDTTPYQQLVSQAASQATGKTLVMRDKPKLVLLPTPHVSFGSVELMETNGSAAEPALQADDIIVEIGYGAIFGGERKITGVTFLNPVLQNSPVHKEPGWFKPSMLAPLFTGSQDLPAISIKNGSIITLNAQKDVVARLDNIAFSLKSGQLSGGLSMNGQAVSLSGNLSNQPGSQNLPTEITLSSGSDHITFKGERGFKDDQPNVSGTLDAQIEDLLKWRQKETVVAATATETLLQKTTKIEVVPTLPLKLTATVAHAGDQTTFSDVNVESGSTAGKGDASIAWQDQPQYALTLHCTNADLAPFATLLAPLYSQSLAQAKAQANFSQEVPNPIPDHLSVKLDLTADSAKYGSQSVEGLTLSAQLADAALTVQQLNFTLAGDSSASLFGVISQGPRGLKFDGSVEAKGKSLRELLNHFEPAAGDLPEDGFGEFSTRSNLYIAADQLRLSEANVKVGTLDLLGGLVLYFDTNPRVEADVRLKDINLDYFRDVWRAKTKEQDTKSYLLHIGTTTDYGWLNRLAASIDFKVTIDGFTFLEQPGSLATFRIFAKRGELGLYNIKMAYPANSIEANLRFNVTGDVPDINLVMAVGSLDTTYFRADPDIEPPPIIGKEPGVSKWSEGLFDFTWMENISGAFDLNVGKLAYRGDNLNNFKIKTTLKANNLNVQNLSFDLWGGTFNGNGSLLGGKVPGISARYTFYNASLERLLDLVTTRDNLSGRASISGVITASGVNWLSWVNSLDMKLVIAARGVLVQGFNMESIITAINAARSTGDVFNNVNQALPEGRTEFSVDGNINIQGTVARTPGITLKTGKTVGNLNGELQLLPWTMKLTTLFQFPFLTSETIPTLTVDLAGPPEALQLTTDTSSLEAYVAKRITGQ